MSIKEQEEKIIKEVCKELDRDEDDWYEYGGLRDIVTTTIRKTKEQILNEIEKYFNMWGRVFKQVDKSKKINKTNFEFMKGVIRAIREDVEQLKKRLKCYK